MLELRAGLESEAAALAAQRRTSDNLAALDTSLRLFREALEEGVDTAPADFQFHLGIVWAAHSPHWSLPGCPPKLCWLTSSLPPPPPHSRWVCRTLTDRLTSERFGLLPLPGRKPFGRAEAGELPTHGNGVLWWVPNTV